MTSSHGTAKVMEAFVMKATMQCACARQCTGREKLNAWSNTGGRFCGYPRVLYERHDAKDV